MHCRQSYQRHLAGDEGINRRLKNRHSLSFEEVTHCLENGLMQIHKFEHGFILTEIKQLPEERILHVYWLGGERFGEWVEEAFEVIKKFGKDHGCGAIEANCRPGLAKMLRAQKFKTIKINVRAEI